MKRNKFFVFLSIVVVALGSFSATLAQDALTAVDLVLWNADGANEEIYQAQFDAWAAEFAPGSTLEIVSGDGEDQRNNILTAGLAAEGLPDLVLGANDPVGVYADAGLVLALDDLLDTSVYPYNLGAGQIAGVTYGVPITAGNHLMFMYNTSLVPEAPQTFEELVAVAAEVEANNEGVQGFAYNLTEPFWFLPFVHGFGGGAFDEEGNLVLDSEEWVTAYQFVHDLKFVDEVVPAECDYSCADSLFKEGSVAMIINGDWAIGDYLNSELSPALGADNFAVAPWPALPNGERPQPFTSGQFVSIPVTVEGDHLAAVLSFVEWLTTDPAPVTAMTLDLSRLPAVASVSVDVEMDPLLGSSAEALATGVGMPANPDLRCMWDSVRPNLEGVMSDSMSPEDAAFEAQFSAEDCLDS